MERRVFLGTSLAGLTVTGAHRRASATAWQDRAPIRLSSNENPLGLSPVARQAIMETIAEGHRYPRGPRTELLAALAAHCGLTPGHVILGNGSTEVLQIAVQSLPPQGVVVMADPTFEDVGKFAEAAGRRLVTVPLRADWAHDVARMRTAAGEGPAVVFICNPNNPTGTITPCDEVDAWIAAADERVLFVLDEAYLEFAEDPRYRPSLPWVARKPNVLVVRTFSKIHAMAGLRLGYGLAQPDTIQRLLRQAPANNANALVLAAARASLSDTAFHQRSLDSNRAARALLLRTLGELGLESLPSHTNFVMHRINGDVTTYNERMRGAGFLVGRPFPPLTRYSRVSLGTVPEMEAFTATLREFRARGWV